MSQTVVVGNQTYKQRNLFAVWFGLPFITFSIYSYVWIYKVNDEARRFLKDDSIRPVMSVLAFIPGAILDGPFSLVAFAANTVQIIALTVIWTWLFNHAGGSVFFAMFVHGVSNAASGLLPRLVTDTTGDPWFGAKVAVVAALLVIVFTRGRLGYQAAGQPETVV